MGGTYNQYPLSGGGGGGGNVGSGIAQLIAFSLGTVDGQAATVSGATITSASLWMQSATGTMPGLMNAGTQTIGGNKTLAGALIPGTGSTYNIGTVPNSTWFSGAFDTTYTKTVTGYDGNDVLVQATTDNGSNSQSLTIKVLPVLQPTGVQGDLRLVCGSGTIVAGQLLTVQNNLGTAKWVALGSISLANRVSGILPLSNVGSGTINLATDTISSLSLANKVSGILPLSSVASISLAAATVASLSLANQVSGILPLSFVGSVSLAAATVASLSLTTQVSGVLPQANHPSTMTFTQVSTGSVSHTSSATGQAYTVTWPGSQGSSSFGVARNMGNGNLAWHVVKGPNVVTLSSGASLLYTPTSGTIALWIRGVGGGGGAGGCSIASGSGCQSAGAGGGGAGYFEVMVTGSALQTNYLYHIAQGGAGATSASASGTTGTSTFITLGSAFFCIGGGGGGGQSALSSSTNGSFSFFFTDNTNGASLGGAATNADVTVPGGPGGMAMHFMTGQITPGYGGPSGFSEPVVGKNNTSTAGLTGSNGAGGSGAIRMSSVGAGTQTGGAGGAGVIIIHEYFQG